MCSQTGSTTAPRSLPPIDLDVPDGLATATFALG